MYSNVYNNNIYRRDMPYFLYVMDNEINYTGNLKLIGEIKFKNDKIFL